MSEDTSRQAFPLSVHPEHGYGPVASVEAGMTLREWYAGMAMQEMIGLEGWTCADVAREAIAYADALIRELAK